MNISIPKPILEFAPQVYYCKKATKEFTLDGRIDKEFWQDIPYTCEFRDIEGESKPIPRFRTRVKMQWDENNIYIAAELMGDEIWAYVSERDDVIFQDNDFEIFIDTNSSTHEYYEFEMNALNTVWDLLLTKPYRDGGSALNAWDIKGLQTAVHIDGVLNNPEADNKFWSLEVVMPINVLSQNIKNGQTAKKGNYWRINFSRVQWTVDIIDNKYKKRENTPENNWIWSPIGVINMHYPEMWGFLFFTEKDETYEIPYDEKIKWELRRLYYAEHKYHDEHGVYCSDFEVLKNGEDYYIHPCIEVTQNNFEISCKSTNKGHTISIFADGKVDTFNSRFTQ